MSNSHQDSVLSLPGEIFVLYNLLRQHTGAVSVSSVMALVMGYVLGPAEQG